MRSRTTHERVTNTRRDTTLDLCPWEVWTQDPRCSKVRRLSSPVRVSHDRTPDPDDVGYHCLRVVH